MCILVLAHPGCPDKIHRAVNGCVCVLASHVPVLVMERIRNGITLQISTPAVLPDSPVCSVCRRHRMAGIDILPERYVTSGPIL